MSNSEEKTPSVIPDQGTTGEPAAPIPLSEAAMENKVEAEQSQFLNPYKKTLELFENLQRQGYDDVLQNLEYWIWFLEFNAMLLRNIAEQDKKKDKLTGKKND